MSDGIVWTKTTDGEGVTPMLTDRNGRVPILTIPQFRNLPSVIHNNPFPSIPFRYVRYTVYLPIPVGSRNLEANSRALVVQETTSSSGKIDEHADGSEPSISKIEKVINGLYAAIQENTLITEQNVPEEQVPIDFELGEEAPGEHIKTEGYAHEKEGEPVNENAPEEKEVDPADSPLLLTGGLQVQTWLKLFLPRLRNYESIQMGLH